MNTVYPIEVVIKVEGKEIEVWIEDDRYFGRLNGKPVLWTVKAKEALERIEEGVLVLASEIEECRRMFKRVVWFDEGD